MRDPRLNPEMGGCKVTSPFSLYVVGREGRKIYPMPDEEDAIRGFQIISGMADSFLGGVKDAAVTDVDGVVLRELPLGGSL